MAGRRYLTNRSSFQKPGGRRRSAAIPARPRCCCGRHGRLRSRSGCAGSGREPCTERLRHLASAVALRRRRRERGLAQGAPPALLPASSLVPRSPRRVTPRCRRSIRLMGGPRTTRPPTSGSTRSSSGRSRTTSSCCVRKGTGEAVLIDAANEHELLLEVSRATGVRRVLDDARPLRPHPGGHPDARRRHRRRHRDAGRRDAARRTTSTIPDDDVIEVGDLRLRTIHTPGHTRGSTCFLLDGHPILFSGDTLFPGGPGNTKFEGASFRQIIQSIDRRLLTLPGDTLVLPGHGLDTTIEHRAPPPRRVGRPRLVTPIALGRYQPTHLVGW